MILLPSLPCDLSLIPIDSYLVGGAVRDALLNRKRDYIDFDFVVATNAIETARNIAKIYRAGFVVLDQERAIARVVFKNATLDFAQQEGETLETDLKRRDFTINAIAYHLHSETIIDPLGGLKDLNKKIIKMISSNNLEDDPLRLLRGYRQASQLNFTIDPDTKSTIKNLAHLIKNIAPERVQTELNYLLKSPNGTSFLREIIKDQLLVTWLKNINFNQLETLIKIDQSTLDLSNQYLELLPLLNEDQSNWYRLAKLAYLVSDNLITAEQELMSLKYSRAEIKIILNTLKSLNILQQYDRQLTLREQYFLFLETQTSFPILAVLAQALGISKIIISPLIERYFNVQDPVAHPVNLITGNDLIKELNLQPSPLIKHLLTEAAIGQIEGKIKTKKDALNYVQQLII